MRDEFAKIDWLKTRFEIEGDSREVLLGIGDDAAVFDFGERPTIVTVDTQVQGVHFLPELLSFGDVGHRAIVSATSDVWAMAGVPSASVLALTLPPAFSDESFRELIDGLAEAAAATGARVIGGNLSQAPCLSITTTVFGAPFAEPLRRSGARPGDSVFVTGVLGAAALGLHLLQAGRVELAHAEQFIERWRRPPINSGLVEPLSQVATAAVDVSDGCFQDLRHLCRASRVGASLQAHTLPRAPGHESLCAELGLDPLSLCLSGGEDYEIVFTAPPSSDASAIGTLIGEISSEEGVRVLDENGQPMQVAETGFRHFS